MDQATEIPQWRALITSMRGVLGDVTSAVSGLAAQLKELEREIERREFLAGQSGPEVFAHSVDDRPSQQEVIRKVVYERNGDLVSVWEVVHVIRAMGYALDTSDRNLFSSVWVSLQRMAKKGEIQKQVLFSEGRSKVRFSCGNGSQEMGLEADAQSVHPPYPLPKMQKRRVGRKPRKTSVFRKPKSIGSLSIKASALAPGQLPPSAWSQENITKDSTEDRK